MKSQIKYIASILFILLASIGYGQIKTTDWASYQNEVIGNDKEREYIYLFYSDGGEKIKLLYYFKKNNEKILAINEGEKPVKELKINSEDLFEPLFRNKTELNKAVGYFNKKGNTDFIKKGVITRQLGIKIKGLNYNHFQYSEPDLITAMPEGKLKKGLTLINWMIETLEEAVLKRIEKNLL